MNLKTKVVALCVVTLFATLARANSALDRPVKVDDYDQYFTFMFGLRGQISDDEHSDLSTATRAIVRCIEYRTVPRITDDEAKALFVRIVNGRTPREIILIGATTLFGVASAMEQVDAAPKDPRLTQRLANGSWAAGAVKMYMRDR